MPKYQKAVLEIQYKHIYFLNLLNIIKDTFPRRTLLQEKINLSVIESFVMQHIFEHCFNEAEVFYAEIIFFQLTTNNKIL